MHPERLNDAEVAEDGGAGRDDQVAVLEPHSCSRNGHSQHAKTEVSIHTRSGKPDHSSKNPVPVLNRTPFRTSRLLDFVSRKELIAQTGHHPDAWPLVAIKEMLDNALDACEDARVSPKITVRVDEDGIEVRDNGPGIPADVVEGVLDFAIRVSTREAYVSPTRGAQGNALKTILAMPFVLDGKEGRVTVDARGVRHDITVRVDRIRQKPVLDPQHSKGLVKNGTGVRVHWPSSACSILESVKTRFLQFADDYTFLNPHLALTVDWHGKKSPRNNVAPL
jgi:DNA topoisomerase VI subunit B